VALIWSIDALSVADERGMVAIRVHLAPEMAEPGRASARPGSTGQ